MESKNSIVLRIVLTAAIPVFVILAGIHIGCKTDQSQAMTSDVSVPASEGTVTAIKGDNNNTQISILVKHLAPPSKIAPDATVYVVWIQPRNGAIQNIGALRLDKDLHGTLNSTTPHIRFQVTVTPEPSGTVAAPSHTPVFTSDVDRGK